MIDIQAAPSIMCVLNLVMAAVYLCMASASAWHIKYLIVNRHNEDERKRTKIRAIPIVVCFVLWFLAFTPLWLLAADVWACRAGWPCF